MSSAPSEELGDCAGAEEAPSAAPTAVHSSRGLAAAALCGASACQSKLRGVVSLPQDGMPAPWTLQVAVKMRSDPGRHPTLC